jgi:glycerol kinase
MTTPPFILALDQGTTSSRSIVFDAQSTVVAMAQKEFEQHFPKPGWVEHNATEIWATQKATITEVLARAHINAGQIAAIGITNQRETIVLWDRVTGQPIAPAIVWQDRRTANYCQQLREQGHEPAVQQITGLLLDPYFSASKLRYLLHTIPGAMARAHQGELACGTIDSWLVWQLTQGRNHVTDISNASRTQLMNLHTSQWDTRLLQLFEIPAAVLPRIVPSSGIIGSTVLDGVEIPISAMAGDQQAALFGQACFSPGMAKNTYGTGCFLLMNTGPAAQASQHRLLSTCAWQLGGTHQSPAQYALEGSVFVAGALVQWLRDGLQIIRSASEIEGLAASVPNSGGISIVPAFTGLGAPHWDPHAQGMIYGVSRGTTRAHIARAALEAIALQNADLIQAMHQDSGTPLTELRVDGGASNNNLLMQLQADLLGVPVLRPKVTETTALGAAYLAGLGVGLWQSLDELAKQWQLQQRFEPQLDEAAKGAKLGQWREAVARCLTR